MPDLQRQHDELMAAVVKAKEAWKKAIDEESSAFARWAEANRRLNEFDKRNEGSDD